MADRNVTENAPSPSRPQTVNALAGDEAKQEENGHHPKSSDGATADAARQAEQRAEELVDQAAQRVAEFTALLKRKLSQVVARAREEVEDIWAEAQSIRRGEK